MATKKLTIADLRKIDLSESIEHKGNLSYVSWASAWDHALTVDEDASFELRMGESGPLIPAGKGYLVQTSVTLLGKTKTCHLPVLDHKNQPIMDPTAFHVNTAIMRCLAKTLALFGLGLYVYRGEDLPPEVERPDYASSIASVASLDALAELWTKLPPEAKRAMRETKDKRKLELSCELHAPTITAIKEAFECYQAGDESALSVAVEAYEELTSEEREAIWVAPSKGGPFTTQERAWVKSAEFGAAVRALYGKEAA